MALHKSEGAGSVWILVHLPGAHLYIQVLGNLRTSTVAWRARHLNKLSPLRGHFYVSALAGLGIAFGESIYRKEEGPSLLLKYSPRGAP